MLFDITPGEELLEEFGEGQCFRWADGIAICENYFIDLERCIQANKKTRSE